MPTAESERAGRRALALAGSTTDDETLVVLLSGGASALLAVPAPGIALDDKRAVTERLLRSGADIAALNTVRKHVSAIKGGRLAASCRGPVATYALSDVVGDDLSVIASGPTVADATTSADALDVLRRFGGASSYPSAVVARLRQGAAGAVKETLKLEDRLIQGSSATVIGSRRNAAAGAAAEAERRGYHVVTIEEPVVGEARAAARHHLEHVSCTAQLLPRPFCGISTGETTVAVTGSGKGGRNQEFVLAGAAALADTAGPDLSAFRTSSPFILASIGTDGVDGPTDAAGALADSTTAARASTRSMGTLQQFLDDNNAHAFFDAMGDLIHTGPTGTNVGDLQIVLLT